MVVSYWISTYPCLGMILFLEGIYIGSRASFWGTEYKMYQGKERMGGVYLLSSYRFSGISCIFYKVSVMMIYFVLIL